MALLMRTGNGYELHSYGYGVAYAFHNRDAARVVYLAGDDAKTFREELERYEDAAPLAPSGDVLAHLWSLYSDVSEEDDSNA